MQIERDEKWSDLIKRNLQENCKGESDVVPPNPNLIIKCIDMHETLPRYIIQL
jgi:hypothetical protein